MSGPLAVLERAVAILRNDGPTALRRKVLGSVTRGAHDLDVKRDLFRWRLGWARALRHTAPPVPPTRRLLVICLTDAVFQVKQCALLAKTLQLRGYGTTILTGHGSTKAHAYLRAAGLTDFVFMDEYTAGHDQAVHAATSEFLRGSVTVQSLKGLEFHGADVGRHALSTASRHLRQGSIQPHDTRVREEIARLLPQTMRAVLAAEKLLDEVAPDVVLFHETGYATYGALSDVAMRRGLNVIQFMEPPHGGDALILKRFTEETRRLHPQSLSDSSWERVKQLPWGPRQEAELGHEFHRRYEGEGFLNRKTQSIPPLRGGAEVGARLGLDPKRKTAVLFSHILWDANLFFGEDLFEDQEEWFIETVRAACANPEVNWVVKLHPANVWKLKRSRHFGELSEKTAIRREIGALPSHVTLLEPDVDVNPYDLFALADYGITIRGTIGLELPCFGKPVLTAGTGRYSGRGFTVDSSSREAYFRHLAQIQDISALTEEQVLLAKRHAHGVFVLRPWKCETLRAVYRPMSAGGHPLDQNLILQPGANDDIRRAKDLREWADWAEDATLLDYLAEHVMESPADVAPVPVHVAA